jgi:4-amino-4-deoxy-L-arabinose transferase-like glycosyltransferase
VPGSPRAALSAPLRAALALRLQSGTVEGDLGVVSVQNRLVEGLEMEQRPTIPSRDAAGPPTLSSGTLAPLGRGKIESRPPLVMGLRALTTHHSPLSSLHARLRSSRSLSPLGRRSPTLRPGQAEAPQRYLRLKTLLSALVFCRGLVLLCLFPPFEGWDEYQHVAYIVHLVETGERPILGETTVPPSLQSRLSEFPHGPYALKTLERGGALSYAKFWIAGDRNAQKTAEFRLSTPLPLYQAQHGPFYYTLAAPLFALAGGVADLRSSIATLRLVNLLLTTASIWIALGIVERMIRNRALYALCSLLIATQPLFLINGVRVANDALGAFLATAAIAVALDPRTFRLRGAMLALGVLMGLASLAKSVHLGLIPFVAVCALTVGSRDRVGEVFRAAWRPALGSLALICAGFLATTFWEFRHNYSQYRSFTVMQESVENRLAGRTSADLMRAAGSVDWVKWARNLWLRKNVMAGGWSWAGDNERMKDHHEVLASIALLGWTSVLGRRARNRMAAILADRHGPLLCAALCASYSAALAYHTAQSQLAWGMPTTNPWYAAAAMPFLMLLLAGGAFSWPVGRLGFVLPLVMALFFLRVESSMLFGGMTLFYAAHAEWNTAVARLAFLQPALLGTSTLYAAILAGLVVAATALREISREVGSELVIASAGPEGTVRDPLAGESRLIALLVLTVGNVLRKPVKIETTEAGNADY